MCISTLRQYSSSALNTVKSYLPSAQTAAKIGIGVAVTGLAGYWLSSQSISYTPSEPTACVPHSFLGIQTSLKECFPIRELEHLTPLANTISDVCQTALQTANETTSLIADQSESVLESIANTTASISQNVMQLANGTSSQITQLVKNVSSSIENITTLAHSPISSDSQESSSIVATFGKITGGILMGLIPYALAICCKKAKSIHDQSSGSNHLLTEKEIRKLSKAVVATTKPSNLDHNRLLSLSKQEMDAILRNSPLSLIPKDQLSLIPNDQLSLIPNDQLSLIPNDQLSLIPKNQFPIKIPKVFFDQIINPQPSNKKIAHHLDSESLVEVEDGVDSDDEDQKASSPRKSKALVLRSKNSDRKAGSSIGNEVETPAVIRAKTKAANEKQAKVNRTVVKALPFAGVGLGMITATADRLLHGSGETIVSVLGEKSKDICRQGFTGSRLLQAVNGFKQWEIKKLALLTPVLPSLAGTVSRIFTSKRGESFKERVKNAFKENFSTPQVISIATLATLGLTNSLYARALGLSSESFDASGHVMLKTVLAHVLSETLQTVAKNGNNAAFAALYALSDAVLMHQTTRICHSTAEVAAGLGWGLSIVAASKLAQTGVSKLTQKFF